jgi:hypothetical protein
VDAYISQGKSVGWFVDMSVRQISLLGFNSLLRYMVTHKSVKLPIWVWKQFSLREI